MSLPIDPKNITIEPSILIAVGGPTASGKTSLAVKIAQRLGGEILSADSRQVYRRMDIGTGKDLLEYQVSPTEVIPYHLIDIEEPGQTFDLYHWLEAFREAYCAILSRKKRPILVGGTGLYLESALKGRSLHPVPQNPSLRKELEALSLDDLKALLRRFSYREGIDYGNARRIIRAIEVATYYKRYPAQRATSQHKDSPIPHLLFYIDLPAEVVNARIYERLYARLSEGMVDEVEALLKEGVAPHVLDAYGLEYRFINRYLQGHLRYNEMCDALAVAIRQFAKRQRTWFRGMERRGFTLHHIDGLLCEEERLCRVLDTIRSESEHSISLSPNGLCHEREA